MQTAHTPKIGIGISDFPELRAGAFLFVDKSFFIQEIIETGAKVLLIPRPRRFGKTLNLSMLRTFFERQENEAARAEVSSLFDGLAIRDTAAFAQHFAAYPVIFLTFKDVKERCFADALYKLKDVISEEYRRLRDCLPLAGENVAYCKNILTGQGSAQEYTLALRKLSTFLYEHCNVPAVILIDEYDTPIHAAWQHGYYDEMISFMRGLLSGGLKDNPHIYKGIITGILRVAKESIFSDLNNLDIYTILERPFADKFGLTPEELGDLFAMYGLEHRLEEADAWYNGYCFGEYTIFNPWSILNFVSHNPPRPEPYWANTSANTLIRDLIVDGGLEVRENMERLIQGKSIESVIDKNIVFPELHKKDRYLYSLFFFSGYLKCVSMTMREEELVCELAIPNREIRYIFRNIISVWLEESFGSRKLRVMLQALVDGNLDQFERLLNEFVVTTLSFFDAKGKNPEAVFQAFVLGMLLNLGQEYEISSNRELGYGRYDILALPRKDRNRPAILMEMKSITGFYRQDPEEAIAEAVEQINNRAYAKELAARGYSNVIRLVVVSDGKKVWVRQVTEAGNTPASP